MEAIANGPLSQLFALMAMPLIGAVLLGGYLIFSVTRRRKKAKMKHGISLKSTADEEAEETTPAVPNPPQSNANPPADTPTPAPPPEAPPPKPVDLELLSKAVDNPAPPENEPASPPQASPPPASPAPPPAPTPTPLPPPQPQAVDEPAELLRLLRHPQSGQLVVEIVGQRYTKLADITDKEVGQQILHLTAHLLAFTNGMIVTDAGMKSVYKPKVEETPPPLAPSDSAANEPTPPAVTPVEPEAKPQPPPSPQTPPLSSFKNTSFHQPDPLQPQGGLLSRVTQPTPPLPSIPSLNLAEEINDLVQARLRYSPLAKSFRVDIKSDLSGGIRIDVNGQFYTSPDEVPDQEVKDLIKDAIKEWERS